MAVADDARTGEVQYYVATATTGCSHTRPSIRHDQQAEMQARNACLEATSFLDCHSTVSLRSYAMGEGMLDRMIGIVGLALALIGLIAQYRWPKAPQWATDLGLACGCVLIGIAVSPVIIKRPEIPIAPLQQKATDTLAPKKIEIRFPYMEEIYLCQTLLICEENLQKLRLI